MTGTPRVDPALVEAELGPFDEMEFKGAGTFGDCWRVRENGIDQILKVLVISDSGRFDRELGALRRLSSPRIMKVSRFGSFDSAGRTFRWFIGEYIAGGAAAEAIAGGRWPSRAEALMFGEVVLGGLADLHAASIVHRDIKPSNVALRRGSWDSPVILDLGLARLLDDSSITVYPARMGTVPYMSPEQLRNERAHPRSDVFSVGVMLYELLTRGAHPFVQPGEQIDTTEALNRMAGGPRDSRKIDAKARTLVNQLLAFHAFDRPDADKAAARAREARA